MSAKRSRVFTIKKILYNPEVFAAWAFPARRVESGGLKTKTKHKQQAVSPREHPSVSACVVSGALPAGPGGGAPGLSPARRGRAAAGSGLPSPVSAGGPVSAAGIVPLGGALCGGVWV